MENWVNYAPFFGVAGAIFAFFLFAYVKSFSSGNETMIELEEMIHDGAMAALLWYGINMLTAVAFLTGAFCSGVAGFSGMTAATRANSRTAAAANEFGMAKALNVSYFGGAVMGVAVASLGLIGVGIWYYFVGHNPATASIINGFAMGASSIALFARMGGGIFTKAADVGADLVGKVEAGIPEDDPRNPGVIADLVGDNVG
ncbi:MAG: sodium/proton-translocating pyrophosphatase, partial [Deltaproteobacteria bacterium]|nr:sodium/proton-translocating pyrophosphatase [Deltaproteobacteria bacterium]